MAYGWMAWLLLPFAVLFGGFVLHIGLVQTVFADPRFLSAFWISLASAFVTAIIAGLFAVPAAYALAFGRFKDTGLLETLMIDIPQTLPPVAVGVVYLFAFGPGRPWNIAFTFAAVVIAKIIVASPFALSHALRRFREIRETKLDLMARSLGADTKDVMLRILVPMSRRELAAGLTLAWARAMGEFGGSLIFAGVIAYRTENLPTYTNRLSQTDPQLALAATTVMVLFSLLALLAVRALIAGKKR
ncbi:MAG TPA: ABC transporter permease subunit [Patescibacteria group bacterium]|nr:ABC transporter permease subunit [Patescibacteria group bacterium]